MKRDFLQALKVGDQALTKDVIDAIMSENGKDIEAAKAQYADYDSIRDQLNTAKQALKGFDGVDVDDLKGQISKLQSDLKAKDAEHKAAMASMQFDTALREAITAAHGRNAKAVTALLDVDTLKASKNQQADIAAAIEALKGEASYLFEPDAQPTPPAFATGTGTARHAGEHESDIAAFRAAAGLTD